MKTSIFLLKNSRVFSAKLKKIFRDLFNSVLSLNLDHIALLKTSLHAFRKEELQILTGNFRNRNRSLNLRNSLSSLRSTFFGASPRVDKASFEDCFLTINMFVWLVGNFKKFIIFTGVLSNADLVIFYALSFFSSDYLSFKA